jgi:steroid delta-isomerase-like uncharacterized protein
VTNAEVIRRFYDDLWNRWRLELADELLAADVRFRGTLGMSLVGRDAFKGYVEQVRAAFPDWHNVVEELISADDAVVARLTFTGTHRGEFLGVAPTGRRVSYVGAAIFHLDHGKITSAWVVGDTQELWRALGVLSRTESRTG